MSNVFNPEFSFDFDATKESLAAANVVVTRKKSNKRSKSEIVANGDGDGGLEKEADSQQVLDVITKQGYCD